MPDKSVAGECVGIMLSQNIQVKEGKALRQTLYMLVNEMPNQIKGKTILCKVDNQALKAIIEKKGSTRMLPLNEIGKQIFWMQQAADFFLRLEYVRSELNVADTYTRQSPGLESSISQKAFQKMKKMNQV